MVDFIMKGRSTNLAISKLDEFYAQTGGQSNFLQAETDKLNEPLDIIINVMCV